MQELCILPTSTPTFYLRPRYHSFNILHTHSTPQEADTDSPPPTYTVSKSPSKQLRNYRVDTGQAKSQPQWIREDTLKSGARIPQ